MNKNRFIRLVALAGCSVLIGAFGYTPAATAHIGASHAPYTTTDPDIRTATIISGSTARVCFDEGLDGATINDDPANFEAVGYDSFLRSSGDSVALDISDTNCARVEFLHPSLAEATIVIVESDTVDDLSGNGNTEGAVELAGSTFNARAVATPGNTDAPEHIDSAINAQDNEIDYTMDEDLDEDHTGGGAFAGGCDPDAFGFHTSDGTAETGDDCTVDGNVVTVGFTEDVTSAVRIFNEVSTGCGFEHATFDLGIDEVATDNTDAKFATNSGGLGNNTGDPDLLSVTRQGNNRLVFAFDGAIALDDEGCFFAYSEDGSVYQGDSFTLNGSNVTVSFDNISGAFQQIVRAGVAPGAVSRPAGGDTNTWGSTALSASGTERSSAIPATMTKGYSDGPDLEQAITDAVANTIEYCYDEPLNTDPAEADEGDHQFLENDGDDTDGSDILSVDDNCVVVDFTGTGDVEFAVAAGVESNQAVQDRLGVCDVANPAGTCHAEGNRNVSEAHVAVDGPPPSGVTPPPAPPGPPGPPGPPPGTPPTVTTGLCDANRATAPVAEILIGTPGPDCIKGFGGDDTIRGRNGADTMGGGPGDDVIAGQRGKDAGRGGAGNDTLRGGPGNDNLRGGAGDDTLAGSKGNDTLRGGKGDDFARGGKGKKDLCRAETQRGCEN